MRVEAFLLCWNEKELMPFVIRHYQKFCDKITIMDNWSTDGSDKLAESLGCEVIKFGNKYFDDSENMRIKNECWKGSDADWVIIADFDEVPFFSFVHTNDEYEWDLSLTDLHTNLVIQKEYGVTIIKTIGWQIMSNEMPKNNLLEITNGYEFSNYAKNIIFNPQKITAINYNPGAHTINPVGEVVYSKDPLYVLHYKHIGGIERTIKRYREYKPRMSKLNRKHGWGSHYNRTPASLRIEWAERMAKSKPLI